MRYESFTDPDKDQAIHYAISASCSVSDET